MVLSTPQRITSIVMETKRQRNALVYSRRQNVCWYRNVLTVVTVPNFMQFVVPRYGAVLGLRTVNSELSRVRGWGGVGGCSGYGLVLQLGRCRESFRPFKKCWQRPFVLCWSDGTYKSVCFRMPSPCLLQFGPEPLVNKNILNCNFACSIWVRNLVCHRKGRIQTEDVWK